MNRIMNSPLKHMTVRGACSISNESTKNDHHNEVLVGSQRFESRATSFLIWSRIRLALVLILMFLGVAAFISPEHSANAEMTTNAVRVVVQVTDLGVLPGGDYSSARAINNLSQAVGLSTDVAHAYQTAIWSGGNITTIDACCAGGLPRLLAINESREAVGWENGGYATNGIYWDASGNASVLPALPGGENRVFAYDINNSGIIVGQSRDGTIVRHGVVWDRTTLIRDLGFNTGAMGINDLGDIVGQALVGADYHAFLWHGGNVTDLGLGSALDINNNGLIVGWTSGQVPVIWREGVMENLPALSGDPIGYGHIVTDLNINGDVVGYAPSPVGTGFHYTAVLWRGGQAINLGFFPGGTSSIAYGINDSGEVVGEGSIVPDGPMHALLWTVETLSQTTYLPVIRNP